VDKHGLILEGVKKSKQKKQDTKSEEPKEFDISQLWNYLKAYIIAKFKVPEAKLKDLKLDPDYFKVSVAVQKEGFDASYVSEELRKAIAKKFNLKEININVTATEIPNRENLFITIEYLKK
jgi:sulfur relay (sulfurtransferase) DsrF/TusC family protein